MAHRLPQTLDLQPLFTAPIREQVALDPAYPDHTNDIWRVRTADEDVIVRAPRPADELVSPFWWGCRRLFGLDPGRPEHLAPLNAQLARLSPLPVPLVLRTGAVAGRQCAVMERLPGERLTDFRALPVAAAGALGRAIAGIHRQRFAWWGTPDGRVRRPLDTFHARLITVMRQLVRRFYTHNEAIAAALAPVCAMAAALPAPESAALVMLDVDASQFLTDGRRLTALVDTDAFATAPRALDFIGYEYELDAERAAAFAQAYRTILPLPDLTAVRSVYRYLYRLMEVQGAVDLAEWLRWPIYFE
jgi:aminoglycoside phosphotransferase